MIVFKSAIYISSVLFMVVYAVTIIVMGASKVSCTRFAMSSKLSDPKWMLDGGLWVFTSIFFYCGWYSYRALHFFPTPSLSCFSPSFFFPFPLSFVFSSLESLSSTAEPFHSFGHFFVIWSIPVGSIQYAIVYQSTLFTSHGLMYIMWMSAANLIFLMYKSMTCFVILGLSVISAHRF